MLNRLGLIALLALTACGKHSNSTVPQITRGPGDTSLYGSWQLAYTQSFYENGFAWNDIRATSEIVLTLDPADTAYSLVQGDKTVETGHFRLSMGPDTTLFLVNDTSALTWASSRVSALTDTLYLSSDFQATLPGPVLVFARGKQP